MHLELLRREVRSLPGVVPVGQRGLAGKAAAHEAARQRAGQLLRLDSRCRGHHLGKPSRDRSGARLDVPGMITGHRDKA